MKDKENQIWQDVANVMCECEDKENFTQKYRTKCMGCNLLGVIRHIVFFLNNSDYQKLPKDSVVLSREEYEKYQNLKRDVEHSFEYNQGYTDGQIKGSKETAEKFIVEMKASETLSSLLDAGWETFYKMICNDMYELAKQFGVEIEEN